MDPLHNLHIPSSHLLFYLNMPFTPEKPTNRNPLSLFPVPHSLTESLRTDLKESVNAERQMWELQ
jgi:hypothetical protein